MKKIVVLTGSGISAESGLKTFRDSNGLWHNHSIYEVATPEAFMRNPGLVLEFYNDRLNDIRNALPNAAHTALVHLEEKFDVTIITQNIDDLHQRAGSSQVIYLHGEILKAKSSVDDERVYPVGDHGYRLGDQCEHGSQLRPSVVWFGEMVENIDLAAGIVRQADVFLVVGTSLTVFPAAGLLHEVSPDAAKHIVSLDLERIPDDFEWHRQKATVAVPALVNAWLSG